MLDPINSARPTARLHSLDVLRGIAVLMVLCVHAPWGIPLGEGFLGRLLSTGSYGVDLFFVLSGFLVSGLLFTEYSRTDGISFGRFWLRRGLKIWPAYYAAYGLTFAGKFTEQIRYYGHADTNNFLRQWPNFLFLQNYVELDHRWPASWSLAVEEHFYTLLPLTMLVALWCCGDLRLIPWLCGIVCVIVPVLRYFGTDTTAIYLQSHYRADALCYGVLLGYVHWRSPAFVNRLARWWPILLFLPLFALAIPCRYPSSAWQMRVLGLTLLAMSFAGLVALAVAKPQAGRRGPFGWGFKCLAWIGSYSYTIYLCQVVAFFGAELKPNLSPPIGVAYFLGGSFVGGVILSHVVERPFLVLRDRWIASAGLNSGGSFYVRRADRAVRKGMQRSWRIRTVVLVLEDRP